ncbi:MAG TPA: response regulator, partial [Pirellulales bacterium]|nr:response regulator [Pirellulales bacterium]
ELRVRDTGIGVSQQSIERIFEPFIQADNSITRRFGGTGLGLTICRRIVESLDGQLTVASEPGKGSVFTAVVDAGTLDGVRMLREPPTDIGRRRQSPQDAELRLPPSRILVVEDGDSNRRLITILLQHAGAKVSTAEDGQQGVERAVGAANAGEPFDLILMDMQMPVLDGYSATRRLREIGMQTPIYALTAHAMEGDEEACLEAGCTGFLTKPIDASLLLRSIYDELQSRPVPEQAAPHRGVELRTRTGLPESKLAAVSELFREEAVTRFDQMRAAAASSQWDVVARAAHWLKGAGGSVGYDQFTAPAAVLEKQARNQAGDAVCQSLDRLEALVDELRGSATKTSRPAATCQPPAAQALAKAWPASGDRLAPSVAPDSTGTILIIDDEQFNIELVQAVLSDAGNYRLVATTDPLRAVSLVFAEKPDVVLLDLHMPQISGFDLLATIRATPGLEELPVLILTASDDRETRRRALELGATDFIAKPLDNHDMLPRVRNALLVKRHFEHLRRHAEALDSQVRLRTAQLEKARRNAVYCLARAAEFRDDDTGRHVIRVGKYAGLIAQQLGWTTDEVAQLDEAAQLHDVGKIGVPDSILLKAGKLTPDEFAFMRRHCGFGKHIFECLNEADHQAVRRHVEIGARILSVEDSGLLETAAIIAQTHHERWDGSGYPLGLAGEDIPLVGRITAVADVFDALSSKRSYKAAFPLNKCFTILEEGRGTQFDPACLDAFFAARVDVLAVQIAHADLG